jgi:hypothetical protein
MRHTLCAIALVVIAGTAHSACAQELDINAVMKCAGDAKAKQSAEACVAARGLFMQHCTSCHSFVPVVRQQKDEAGWSAVMSGHRERTGGVADPDYEAIGQFLKDHFTPDRPVPELPQHLIDNDPGFPPA